MSNWPHVKDVPMKLTCSRHSQLNWSTRSVASLPWLRRVDLRRIPSLTSMTWNRNATNSSNRCRTFNEYYLRQVSEDSLDFFDNFASVREKADRPRRPHKASNATPVKGSANFPENVEFCGSDEGAKPQPAPRTRPRSRFIYPPGYGSVWGPELISGPQAETVYSEVLFSIVHAISFIDFPSGADDLFTYLRNSFQISETKHQELLDAIHQRSPPEVTLQLGVIEARNLRAKDVSGTSDPFCTIWISSTRQKQENSSMKHQTLCPVWNENFTFTIKNVNEDVLHIEMWHFNSAESIKDKMSRLRTYQGLGKLFKGIAVASKASGKPCHEFLGLLTIPLKVVPISGMERWFSLIGRDPSKTKERGELKLSLALSASKGDAQFNLKESYMQYELSLRSFVEYELRLDPEWRGKLRESASTILRQFAAHRGLRPVATDVCLWSVYAAVIRQRTLDFNLIHTVLIRLDRAMDKGKVCQELCEIFWSSSEKFVASTLEIVRHIRNSSELCNNTANFVSLLQCLEYYIQKGQSAFPDLVDRINDAITMGAADWLSRAVGTRRIGAPISDDDRLEHSIRICQLLMSDLKGVLTWQNEHFLKILQVPCFSIVYRYYDTQLFSTCKPVIDSITRSLKTLNLSEEKILNLALEAAGESARPVLALPSRENSPEKNSNPKLTMGTALFELYICLQQFHRLSNALALSERENVKLSQFHLWFTAAVGRWLDIAFYKAMIRIGKAIAMDSFTPVDPLVKHSSSAVDAVSVFYQIKTFWEQLSWPDPESALTFVLRMIDDVNRCSAFYAEAITLKLERLNMYQNGDVFYVNQSVCVAMHSILHIRQSLQPLTDHLGVNKLCQVLKQNNYDAAVASDKTKDTVIENAIENINVKLEEIFFSIARRVESEVIKIIESDSNFAGSMAQVDQLISYLDVNLKTLNSQMDTATFNRLLGLISQRVLHAFYNHICKDIESKRQPSHFQQWNNLITVTANFFYGSDRTEQEERDDILAKIKRILKLHGSDSSYLIQQYHLERLAQTPEDTHLGMLTVRAVFAEEKLIVEILNARNLKKMDARGLADPYVKLQLIPRDKFKDSNIHKTKVQKHTVFPLFDETFTFNVPSDLQSRSDCFVALTVKDYDLLGANEFMGEAFLGFQLITRANSPLALKEVNQIHLNLSRPCNKDSEYLQILEGRTWDKAAKEFVKRERKRMNGK